MAASADRGVALVDDRALGTLCMRVLEHMGLGVIACDDELAVLAATPTARRLLAELTAGRPVIGARLPEPIARATVAYLRLAQDGDGRRRRTTALRVDTGAAGRAVYVASRRIDGLPPATLAIRLHQEQLSDQELFLALREKFDLNARDCRILAQLRRRRSNAEIAAALGLTRGSAKVYVHQVYQKLDVHSRGELLAILDRVRRGHS